jgi:hypothetical protein
MTIEQTVALILAIGTLLPLVTAIVQQKHWSSRTRTIIGVGMSILAGLVAWVSTHGLEVSDLPGILATVLGVTIAALAAYEGVWKPSGLANVIEVATSPAPVPARAIDPAVVAPTTTANADSTVTFDPGNGQPPITTLS